MLAGQHKQVQQEFFLTDKQKIFLNSIQMEFSSEKDEKPIYIKTQNYDSIQKVWSDYSDYKQTSAGLNHYRRDVIIADFDASLEEFNEIFNNAGLPKFSYILVNKNSGHVQAGYILKTPFVWTPFNETEKELYLKCKRNLNSFCPDNGYKGWRCKNPYYKEFETTWNNVIYDKDYITGILLYINSNNNLYIKKYNKDNKTDKRKLGRKFERIAGRNNYYLYKTIKYYSQCKTDNLIISLEKLTSWLEENEFSFRQELYSLNQNIKNEPLPKEELISVCKNAKKYVDKNYDKDKIGRYSKTQRENSLELRQIESERKFIDFCDYMDGGVDFKEILPLVGIKKTVGYEYKKLYNELIQNGTYYYFRDSKGYCLSSFNMVHENQLKYPYITFSEFK